MGDLRIDFLERQREGLAVKQLLIFMTSALKVILEAKIFDFH